MLKAKVENSWSMLKVEEDSGSVIGLSVCRFASLLGWLPGAQIDRSELLFPLVFIPKTVGGNICSGGVGARQCNGNSEDKD